MSATRATLHSEMMELIRSGRREAIVRALKPADARFLLGTNTHNRTARTRITEVYATDMKSGRWVYAAEPIKFSVDGVLLDGQHRLIALASLVDSDPDLEIDFMLVTGLDHQAQSVMDQGAKRTAGDNLGLEGIKNANEIAAAARFFILWQEDRMFISMVNVRAQASNIEVQEWVLGNPDFMEACYFSLKHRKDVDMSARIFMACHAAFRLINRVEADEFVEMWAKGANLQEGHPVLTLRERLARVRRDRLKTSDKDNLAFVITAWNAIREGKSLTKFQRPRGQLWTKANFPVPV